MNKLVEQIHSEFDQAQERILVEANRILNEKSSDNEAERLFKLGFEKIPKVQQHIEGMGLQSVAEFQAKIITYYKQEYPFQKFLTENELNRICKKYNLVYAPVKSYKKDVPVKNISEIEGCPTLKETDLPRNKTQTKLTFESWFLGGGRDFLGSFSKWQRMLPKTLDGHLNQWEANEILNKTYNTGIKYLTRSVAHITINKQGFFIAAPASHFDKSGLINSKYGFFSFAITEPKDPIVFRFCRGGVQVVSKWGLESEAIVNEKLN